MDGILRMPVPLEDLYDHFHNYLDREDFIFLMMTGDRSLRCTLTEKAKFFQIEPLHGTKFPFAALKLPQRRTLSILGTDKLPVYLDFRNGGELALAQGNKTIEEIELRFRNSLALFLSPQELSPKPPSVSVRFPSLTTLSLHNIVSINSIDRLFGEFPESLTKLSLHFATNAPERDTLYLSSVANLPRNLKTLELVGCVINEAPPKARLLELRSILPPKLVHLHLDFLSSLDIIRYLPSSLETLTFEAEHGTSTRWKTSSLPLGLVSLKAPPNVLFDARLPSKMEIFEFYPEASLPMRYLKYLPESLKIVPNLVGVDATTIIKNFPNIERVTIDSSESLSKLPKTAKSLSCEKPLTLKSDLPRSLVTLRLGYAIHLNSLKHVPSSLTSLTVEKIAEKPSSWGELDFDHIANRIRLVSLEMDWKQVANTSSVTPLASMQTLKKLVFRRIPLEDWFTAGEWLPECLPTSLTEFDFIANDLNHDQTKYGPPFEEFWTAKAKMRNFDEITPNLTSLNIECHYKVCLVTLSPASFASLPRGLRKLNLYIANAALQRDAIAQLPETLQSLHLHLYQTNRLCLTSNAHFTGLPPSIAELKLFTAVKHPLNAEIIPILPKTIGNFEWAIKGSSLTEEKADNPFGSNMQNFLRSDSLFEGFAANPEEDSEAMKGALKIKRRN